MEHLEHFGILSLVPPILAVVLAFWTKNVVIALFVSVLSGAFIIGAGNPYTAVQVMFQDYFFAEMTSGYNTQTIILMALIGGFVAMMEKSGGAQAFAKAITRTINTRVKAQVVLWLGGLGIFFTDSGNSLILGPTFKPMTDKLRISREKLSYILDSTSSPVSILLPFTGWGVFIMGIIATEYESIGYVENEFAAFISAIPMQFYALTALFLVPMVAISSREFGPMAKAEHRALYENKVLSDTAVPLRPDTKIELPEGVEPRLSSILAPLAVLFIVMFAMFVSFGFPGRMAGPNMRTAMGTAYLLAAFTCMALVVKNKAMTFKLAFDTYMSGMQRMMYILVVLVLAWSVGSICGDLGTSRFLVSVTQGLLSPGLLPALIFVIGGVIAFATGTSWGTFAILLPIAIPMAAALGAPMHACIAAVLSGGLFGDHCSPISDTTILSSMAAASDHVDHVKTQIPYALTAAGASFIAYVFVGMTGSTLAVIVAFAFLIGLYLIFNKFFGETLPRATVEEIESGKFNSIEQ